MSRIFLDTDVLLDILADRTPHYRYSSHVLDLVVRKKHSGFVSALIFSNLYYLINKKNGSKKAIAALKKISDIVEILPVDSKTIKQALDSDFTDFEDAIQYHTALRNNIEYFITRNIKDYSSSEIPVMLPEEFIKSERIK